MGKICATYLHKIPPVIHASRDLGFHIDVHKTISMQRSYHIRASLPFRIIGWQIKMDSDSLNKHAEAAFAVFLQLGRMPKPFGQPKGQCGPLIG